MSTAAYNKSKEIPFTFNFIIGVYASYIFNTSEIFVYFAIKFLKSSKKSSFEMKFGKTQMVSMSVPAK